MITLKVDVTGGIPPIPIMVDITNLNTKKNIKFESLHSFVKTFEIGNDKYTLIVSGMNPEGGKTEANLTGTFIDGPYPSSKKTSEKAFFSELFFFTI